MMSANSFYVYPNPASDEIRIGGNTDNANVEVRNALGQLIFAGHLQNNEVISVSGWANGLYFVRVNGSNCRTLVQH
jgi:hypothetical protein